MGHYRGHSFWRENIRKSISDKYDFYVDSVNGNDGNDGRTPGSAFRTLGALGVIAVNIRIGLAKGSHWREQLTINNNNVQISAYGSGATPLLDGSNVILSTDWLKTGGRVNVYEAIINFTTPGVNTWIRAWEDDNRMVRVASVAACDATQNSYFPSSDTVSPATLYIHASDSSDPRISGMVYEFNSRNNGLNCNSATGTIITGINVRRGNDNNGSLVLGRSSIVTDVISYEGTKHNIFLREGCNLVNVDTYECYYAGLGSTMFVVADTNPTGLPVYFENCDCENTVYDASVGGFFWEVIGVGGYASINFNNCNGIKVATAFAGVGTSVVNIDISTVSGGHSGLRMDAAGTYTVNNVNWSGVHYAMIVYNAVSVTLVLSNAVLTSTHAAPLIIYGSTNNPVCNLTSVTFIGNANTIAFYNTGANKTLTATLCNVPLPASFAWATFVPGESITSDFNTFRVGIRFHYNAAWIFIAAWRIATGQDLNSTG